MEIATNFKTAISNIFLILRGTTRFILGDVITDMLVELKDMLCLSLIGCITQFLSNSSVTDLFFYADKEIRERQFRKFNKIMAQYKV